MKYTASLDGHGGMSIESEDGTQVGYLVLKRGADLECVGKFVITATEMFSELQNLLRCIDRDSVPERRQGSATLVAITDAMAERIRELVKRLK